MLEVFSKVPRAGFAAAQDDNQDLKTTNTSLWMYCAECFLGGSFVGLRVGEGIESVRADSASLFCCIDAGRFS
jgi:hypothetical protein